MLIIKEYGALFLIALHAIVCLENLYDEYLILKYKIMFTFTPYDEESTPLFTGDQYICVKSTG